MTLISDPETVIVHCVEAREEGKKRVPAAAGAEPEVIGRKAEEEEAEE